MGGNFFFGLVSDPSRPDLMRSGSRGGVLPPQRGERASPSLLFSGKGWGQVGERGEKLFSYILNLVGKYNLILFRY